MTRLHLLAGFACTVAACSEPVTVQPYTVVTVAARPAVHDATRLRVTLSNSGAERTQELELAQAFPVTFSVSAPERDGDLGIEVEALDDNDLVIGRGSTMAMVDDAAASVLLDSMDFVVNTDVAGDQYPSDDFEAHGFQVAADSNGLWTVGFRDTCSTPCNMMARRFDVTGKAATTRIAAGTNAFPVTTDLTDGFFSTPAIGVAGQATLAVWGFSTPSPSTNDGVGCRSLDPQGNATPTQLEIGAEPSAEVVSIVPLSNQNFAVAWDSMSPRVIRAAILRADCTVAAAPVTVSTLANPRRAAVAAHPTANKILYAWVVSGAVHVRIAGLTNAFDILDTEFLPAGADPAEHVRVAPLGSGFAIVVRFSGHIDLYRTTATGALIGTASVITPDAGIDFLSTEAFGVVTSSSDKLFVTWHACDIHGDTQGCGVFGRAINSDGTPASDVLLIPTTTVGDQVNPSVAALPNDAFAVVWRDNSGQAPDASGSAVRARIIYLD